MVKKRVEQHAARRELRQLLSLLRSAFPHWAQAPTESQFVSLYRAHRGHLLDPTAYGCKSNKVLLAKLLRAAERMDASSETTAAPDSPEEDGSEQSEATAMEAAALEQEIRWLPRDAPSSGSRLHEQMIALANLAAPDEAEVSHRREAVLRLCALHRATCGSAPAPAGTSKAAAVALGSSAPVQLFGSSASGLSLPASDLDVSVQAGRRTRPLEVLAKGVRSRKLAEEGSLQVDTTVWILSLSPYPLPRPSLPLPHGLRTPHSAHRTPHSRFSGTRRSPLSSSRRGQRELTL